MRTHSIENLCEWVTLISKCDQVAGHLTSLSVLVTWRCVTTNNHQSHFVFNYKQSHVWRVGGKTSVLL